uniref:Uncharacterized protein n=1 Tax=Arundo donax TaxID=35708 RepID=A0A0A9GFR9_ARUDO
MASDICHLHIQDTKSSDAMYIPVSWIHVLYENYSNKQQNKQARVFSYCINRFVNC